MAFERGIYRDFSTALGVSPFAADHHMLALIFFEQFEDEVKGRLSTSVCAQAT
jgi:hypothetical protein